MPRHSHLFIMDPFTKLNLALDSSLAICVKLVGRGHEAYFAEPADLFWESGHRTASARVKKFIFANEKSTSAGLEKPEIRNLKSFSAIHMRKDPPFDLDYIATTWLLETVASQVRVYNSPNELRSLNEKLAIFHFPEYTRKALLSCEPARLLQFIKQEAHGDGILKPIHLYGGKGVIRINLEEIGEKAALALLTEATGGGQSWRVVQAFDRSIFAGEVRAFAVAGKAMAWCLKLPQEGSFLANTGAGAKLQSYKPSADETRNVEAVAKVLQARGVAFIGFDVIGGYISEINITSPRLLKGPDDQTDYYAAIAQWIEQDLA